jgi:hypothetical protein
VQLYDITDKISTSLVLQRWRSNIATADIHEFMCISTRFQGQLILIGAVDGRSKGLWSRRSISRPWQTLAENLPGSSFPSYLHIVLGLASDDWLSDIPPQGYCRMCQVHAVCLFGHCSHLLRVDAKSRPCVRICTESTMPRSAPLLNHVIQIRKVIGWNMTCTRERETGSRLDTEVDTPGVAQMKFVRSKQTRAGD